MHPNLVAAALLVVSFTSNADGAELSLRFPADDPCGLVTVCQPPASGSYPVHDRVIGHAVGEVPISTDQWILLELKAESKAQREAIQSLPQEGIRGLRITGGTLDRQTVASLTQIKSLEYLDFRGCAFTAEAFHGASGLPKLVSLMARVKVLAGSRRQMVRWIRDSTKLDYLYWTGTSGSALPRQAWDELGDHATLGFINVDIESDGAEVLRSVAKLKNLHGINLDVASSADPTFPEVLPKLNGVRWINWSGGSFGPREAEIVAGMKSLKSLVLQGEVQLPADFPLALEKLVNLDKLTINTQNVAYDRAELPPILASLPNLKHWPQIDNLDAAGLAHIDHRTDIKSLDIQGFAANVDRQKVKQFIKQQSLERLYLSDSELDGLDFLKGQDNLEILRLKVALHGDQLSVLDSLPKLKGVQLQVGGADRLSLAALGRCPQLQAIELTGELMVPRDLELLARSGSLRRLSIQSGLVDDSAVEQLCGIKTLTDLSLGRDSILTDFGVRTLAAKKVLETLDIGGFITESGVAILGSLPRLRSLVVRSTLIDEEQQESISRQLRHVPLVRFYPSDPLRGPWEKGKDGFIRLADEEFRRGPAQLEGDDPPPLRGEIVSKPGHFVNLAELKGKVVVIEFWGVWCGPCISMMPLLSHLNEEYGKQGLVIVGVHAQQGADGIGQFLKTNPKAWANIVDSDKTLEESYRVERHPTLFLVDKAGRIRVAQPHVVGLEDAVKRLLKE
jgi:thiol-disulfide isomerase/thioredoxin